jgi:hypothetical protein
VPNSLDPDLIDFFGNPYESRLPELAESPGASIRAIQQLVVRIARTKRAGWLTVSVSTGTPQTRHILDSYGGCDEPVVDTRSAQSREFHLRRRQISRHHGRFHQPTPRIRKGTLTTSGSSQACRKASPAITRTDSFTQNPTFSTVSCAHSLTRLLQAGIFHRSTHPAGASTSLDFNLA